MLGTNSAALKVLLADRPRFGRLFWWGYAACLVVAGTVSATSFWIEAARYGRQVSFGALAVNEATSVVTIFILTWPVLAWTGYLARRVPAWPMVVAGHIGGLLLFDLLHILGMNGLRLLVFSVLGRPFNTPPFWHFVVYELRKDVLVYGGMVGAILLLQRALRRPAAEPTAPPSLPPAPPEVELRIEVRDGARRVWVTPAEILWVEAAGNYVELHTAGRSLLWRRTLAAVEADLASAGFQRIHRSRLVNPRHIRSAANNDSGDFLVTLSNGAAIGGARRWREAFDKAAAQASLDTAERR